MFPRTIRFLLFLHHLTTGQLVTKNTSSSVNVAGTTLNLPLKISIVSSVLCVPGVTDVACPGGKLEYNGPGRFALGAIPLAQRSINSDPSLWPLHNMTVSLTNTQGFAKYGMKQVISAVGDPNTLAVFGLDDACDQAEMIASAANKLAISTSCVSSTAHSTSVQMGPDYTKVADAVVSFIRQYGWDRLVLVYFYAFQAEMASVRARLRKQLLEADIKIADEYTVRIWSLAKGQLQERFAPYENANMILAKLFKETYLKTRVYVVFSSVATASDAYYFTNTMGRFGLLQTGEYVVLTVYGTMTATFYDGSDSVKSSRFFLGLPPHQGPLMTPTVEETFHNFRSAVLFTRSTPPSSPRLQRFVTDMTDLARNYSQFGSPCPPICNMSLYSYHKGYPTSLALPVAPTMYEALLYYARLIKNDSSIPIELDGNATAIETILLSTSGYSSDGRRGIYGVAVFQDNGRNQRIQMRGDATFNWVNGRAPPEGPRCGFDGEKCPRVVPPKTWLIFSLSMIATFMVAAFTVYYWRKIAFERQLEKAMWKILLEDLILQRDLENYGSMMSSMGSMASQATLRMHKSRMMLKDDREAIEEVNPTIRKDDGRTRMTKRRRLLRHRFGRNNNTDQEQWQKVGSFATALHKGKLVALKRIYKKPNPLTRGQKKELLTVTSLRHSNINQLLGIVFETPLVGLVSEYCTKGSLKDMLENDEIRLDRIMRASLVFDLIDGLKYLHLSRLRSHGRLKSSNCVIDSKWILRLSEFGLDQFRNEEDRPFTEEEVCKKLLWTAPEQLRAGLKNIPATPSGDIYSFGIILHEIFGRQGPFGDPMLEPVDAIERLKHPKPNEPLFRPDMQAVADAPDFVRQVMKECWEEEPSMRPTIMELKEKLEPLRAGMSPNLLDNVAMMIEKYNNNLEELVSERIHDIELEKRKSDALLAEMLPSKVADALKHGRTVEPERFECVTIYFSDIIGFGDIVRKFSALEVVKFLHNVFTMFDGMISDYDAYKVETIGDSYVAVSGLPKRNGDNHAGEIASMSLRFIKAATERKFYQPNGEMVQLRIGIHSGPCVAGVVGLLMPRYCLFGDTVNTASRMESNGQALKIHCSEECKRILDTLGGYETTRRGFVKMKGKGEKLTYWLVNEDSSRRVSRMKAAKK